MQGIEAAQVVVKSEPWRVLDEADAGDVPAFCCLHLGADKITAGLRRITLDQCAGIEVKAV